MLSQRWPRARCALYKWIDWAVAEIWPFAYLGGIWNGTPFGVRGGRRVLVMAPFERVMVVSYRLSIVTVALSVTNNHSASVCNRMSPTLKSTNVGSLRAKISGCSPWSRPLMFGSAESEHPRLTNGEIILEEFQPMWSQSTNVIDGRTDRQTTCDCNAALCTKVHRALNKKAQLSLTNPRDAKTCQKLLQFDVLTTLSLTILVYLHSFSSWSLRNLRNPAKFSENSNLLSSRSSKVIDLGANRYVLSY